MAWHRDPQLFIGCPTLNNGINPKYWISRIVKNYNVPIISRDDIHYVGKFEFYPYFSLGNNHMSDYAALKSYLAANNVDGITRFVNHQGLVVHKDNKNHSGTWSRDENIKSIINRLPGIFETRLDENKALEKKNSELVAENSILKDKLKKDATNIQEQLNQEKNDKRVLEQQIIDFTAKLEEARLTGGGSAEVQPWMSGGDTVSSHLVTFEDLNEISFPENTSATITEGPSKPRFAEDATTNVLVNRFYRGAFMVAVNIEELIPDSEKARFDPDIWGLYDIGGVSYAARKPLESEMSVSPHNTGSI